MQTPFTLDIALPRVRFGRGERMRLAEELELLGIRRAMLLSTPDQAEQARRAAGAGADRIAVTHPCAAMHTPVAISDAAVAAAQAAGCDGLVAVGGGSTINFAKAITLRTGLPAVALPTTYAGSEMTPILGETMDGEKRTIRNRAVVPRAVIYDADLVDTLPAAVAGPSGLNAMAHAVEALYAPDRNPIVSGWATDAIAALASALPGAIANDAAAREHALHGAWLASICLASVTMGLHHKLCHTLGGSFGLPHAETHAVMLAYSLAYNAAAAPEAAAAAARAMKADNAPVAIHALLRSVSPVQSLKSLGLARADLDRAADLAIANPYPNPRPLDRTAIRTLVEQAWSGSTPDTP